MYEGSTPTKFGRAQTAPPLQMRRLVTHDGTSRLRETDHPVPIPVLDQEDLFAQGIDTSKLVAGARRVDALGSCTANAGTAHAAERYAAAGRGLLPLKLPSGDGTLGLVTAGLDAARVCEEFAIVLYHLVTGGTGDPAQEWPPADCGSSGYYVAAELERTGAAATYKTGSGVHGALVLLQAGSVMQGLPWFNAWMEPDSQGFIDGDGSYDAFQAAVQSGVAGGHETLQRGIAQMAQAKDGTVDLAGTVIRCRNSWSASWGPLGGEFLVHASTLALLGSYADFKQVAVAKA